MPGNPKSDWAIADILLVHWRYHLCHCKALYILGSNPTFKLSTIGCDPPNIPAIPHMGTKIRIGGHEGLPATVTIQRERDRTVNVLCATITFSCWLVGKALGDLRLDIVCWIYLAPSGAIITAVQWIPGDKPPLRAVVAVFGGSLRYVPSAVL